MNRSIPWINLYLDDTFENEWFHVSTFMEEGLTDPNLVLPDGNRVGKQQTAKSYRLRNVDDNVASLPRILRVLHSGHVKHPARRNGHVRVMVLVSQVNHLRDARLNDHLAAVVAGEQRNVHLR